MIGQKLTDRDHAAEPPWDTEAMLEDLSVLRPTLPPLESPVELKVGDPVSVVENNVKSTYIVTEANNDPRGGGTFTVVPAVCDVCDVCTAAGLAERGVMPTSLMPDELHAKCRNPGACACGCEYSKGVVCVNCKRIRVDDRVVGPDAAGMFRCTDTSDCAKAMLAGARASVSAGACACGCGEKCSGTYKVTHAKQHLLRVEQQVRDEEISREQGMASLPTDAQRALLEKRLTK